MEQQQICALHSVKIAPSNIVGGGWGLFTLIPRKNKDLIVPYEGVLLDFEDMERKFAKGESNANAYIVAISQDLWMDATDSTQGIGRFANTSRKTDVGRGNNNARFSVYGQRVNIRAKRNINAGSEIYVSYGRGYRLDSPAAAATAAVLGTLTPSSSTAITTRQLRSSRAPAAATLLTALSASEDEDGGDEDDETA